jgi:hypothetical protein
MDSLSLYPLFTLLAVGPDYPHEEVTDEGQILFQQTTLLKPFLHRGYHNV